MLSFLRIVRIVGLVYCVLIGKIFLLVNSVFNSFFLGLNKFNVFICLFLVVINGIIFIIVLNLGLV